MLSDEKKLSIASNIVPELPDIAEVYRTVLAEADAVTDILPSFPVSGASSNSFFLGCTFDDLSQSARPCVDR
jgi:hypothetical protein